MLTHTAALAALVEALPIAAAADPRRMGAPEIRAHGRIARAVRILMGETAEGLESDSYFLAAALQLVTAHA